MVLSPDEIVNDPHAQAIGMFTEFDHPVVGRAGSPATPPPSTAPRPPSVACPTWASTPTRY